MLWGLLFGGLYLFAIISALVCAKKFSKFGFIKKLTHENKKLGFLAGFLIMGVIFGILALLMSTINIVIVFLHLLVFWLIIDGLWKLLEKKSGKKSKRYYAGGIAIAFTAVYLGIGAYLDFNVWKTEYNISTDKEIGNLKVAMIADSHVGSTFNAEGFEKHLEKLQAENPDVLIVSGDFVDDGTSKEDMINSCKALGNIKTTYGIYFVFGNHDKGYFNSREYTGTDVINELKKNGVIVLQDEAVLVDGRFYIVGRQDKSESMRGGSRKSVAELVEGLDSSKYMIVADHQPKEYDEEEKAGVDLVLSGHTHGGQVFPSNIITDIANSDDRVYGHEQRTNTNYIVTSGISDWEIIFKTCCYSEFVIVNISGI